MKFLQRLIALPAGIVAFIIVFYILAVGVNCIAELLK